MSAQDDPEARIRDLERPLSDAARTSELGTQPYPTGYREHYGNQHGDQQYPPVQPWPAEPPLRRTGRSAGTVIAVVAAVLGCAVAAAIAVFLATNDSNTTAGRPTFSGGGGGFPSAAPPTVPPVPTVPRPSLTVVVPPGQPGGQITVSGAGVHRTADCRDGHAIISGVGNTVELTGNCAGVTISGIENVVTVDSSAKISVSGINNRITYHSGDPEVSNSGFDNIVELG